MFIAAGCSAPPPPSAGVPTPEPPTPFSGPRPEDAQPAPADLPAEDRPPTPEELAAAAQPEAPPTAADVAAAADLPPADPADNPLPVPPADADVTDVSRWEEGAAQPPYSAWTRAAGVTLRGMGGDALLTLERAGVRVEVLGERGGELSVQCIGCPTPWRNAGGLLPADALQPMMRAVPEDSPMAALLPERVAWARSQEGVPAGLDRDALCRISDGGYTISGGVATWEGDGGRIAAKKRGGAWVLDLKGAPTAASGTWRCPLTTPAG